MRGKSRAKEPGREVTQTQLSIQGKMIFEITSVIPAEAGIQSI